MLRSSQGGTDLLQARVSVFLQDKADSLHSKRLSLLAVHVAEDPFAKVKTMIQEMLEKLLDKFRAELDGYQNAITEMWQQEEDSLNNSLEKTCLRRGPQHFLW